MTKLYFLILILGILYGCIFVHFVEDIDLYKIFYGRLIIFLIIYFIVGTVIVSILCSRIISKEFFNKKTDFFIIVFTLTLEVFYYYQLFKQEVVRQSLYKKTNKELFKFIDNIENNYNRFSYDHSRLNIEKLLELVKDKKIKRNLLKKHIKLINNLYKIKDNLKTYDGKKDFERDIIDKKILETIKEINEFYNEKESLETLKDEVIIKKFKEKFSL